MMTKFLKSIFATIAIALLANLVACSVISDSRYEVAEEQKPDIYDDVLVSTSDLPLFTDFGGMLTRSSTAEEDNSSDTQLVTLESLLDRDKTISKTFKHYVLKEIPFKSNESPSYAVLSSSVTNAVSSENLSEISLFLIETTDTVKNTIDRKVVTMIPDREYAGKFTGERWSFIDKGVFSGAILFSNLDGSYRDVYVYGGDFCPIIDADVIDESDRASYSRSGFLSVVSILGTKTGTELSDGGILIEGSICIAERTIVERMNANASTLINSDDIDWLEGSAEPNLGTGGGGGGGSSSAVSSGAGSGISLITDTSSGSSSANTTPITAAGSYWGSTPTVYMRVEDIQNYTVSLYATEGGMTSGSGTYQTGTFVQVCAIPDSLYVFDRWTGDLNGRLNVLEFPISSDITSTSYFRRIGESGPLRPCYDAEKGMYNPLKEMILAPTDSSKIDFIGATFGYTRNGGNKFHSGLDLYAEEGTPVYAMYDGMISKRQRFVVSQPNRDEVTGELPEEYVGDDNGAGNRFSIESEVDGQTVFFLYWHLNADTPVAINPRTGNPFKPGDAVYAGELVGYTGRTGNAYNVDYYHLHLSVKNAGGIYLNPEDFINGSLQWDDSTGKSISTTQIAKIKCNDEFQDTEIGL